MMCEWWRTEAKQTQVKYYRKTEDELAKKEEERMEGKLTEDILRVNNLVKQYKNPCEVAVKGTSFGVKKGEIFTLLGVNGAGKTTTFKCLVGDESFTDGQVRMGSMKMPRCGLEPPKLHNIVGYCP